MTHFQKLKPFPKVGDIVEWISSDGSLYRVMILEDRGQRSYKRVLDMQPWERCFWVLHLVGTGMIGEQVDEICFSSLEGDETHLPWEVVAEI